MPIYPLQSIPLSRSFYMTYAGGDPAESPKGKKADILHATYIRDKPATPHFNLEPKGLRRHLLPVHSCPPSIYAAGKRAHRKNKPFILRGRVPSLKGLYITTSARR